MKISIFLLLINVAFAQTLIKPATNSVNSFNFKLNSTLDSLSDDFVYSSYSITTALSMLYIGSVGDSKNEIMKTFEFSENVDSCASYFNTFSNTLNTNSFKSINALWSDSTRVEFLTPYIRTIDNQYGAKNIKLNFNHRTETKDTINNWAKQNTNNLIEKIIEEDQITGDLGFILANASYFNGKWLTPFKKENTYKGVFHNPKTGDMPVQYMKEDMGIFSKQTPEMNTYIIPYKGHKEYLVIIQPKKNGLNLENTFNEINFQRLLISLEFVYEKVTLHLPRFQLSFSKEISPELKQLGVTSAYNGGLNNVGNGSRGELALSFVKHDAVLMVEEEGTKAAAVTTVGSVSRGLSTTPPREIKIDKPFYFAVVNKELKTILFWGKLSNPENWKD